MFAESTSLPVGSSWWHASGTCSHPISPLLTVALLFFLVAPQATSPVSLLKMLGPTALETVAGLGVALVGGRVVLRRIFEVVAQSRNSEAFLALTLLTVAGAAYTTQQMGFSDTMGAFLAGVLLSETNYKTQIEADVKPFRGLLLGLFFTTTGASIDMQVRTWWGLLVPTANLGAGLGLSGV